MNQIILLSVVIFMCECKPQFESTTPIPIITQYEVNNADGSFNNSFETGNGIHVQNSGFIKVVNVPRQQDEQGGIIDEHTEQILVQTGSFSYQDPDGNIISLSYIADENGFQPTGDHLPQPPQIVHNRFIQEQQQQQNFVQERPIEQGFNRQPLTQQRSIQQRFS